MVVSLDYESFEAHVAAAVSRDAAMAAALTDVSGAGFFEVVARMLGLTVTVVESGAACEGQHGEGQHGEGSAVYDRDLAKRLFYASLNNMVRDLRSLESCC
jgi:hypothetical protein